MSHLGLKNLSNSFNEPEKGLFTFYRQQAEYEQELQKEREKSNKIDKSKNDRYEMKQLQKKTIKRKNDLTVRKQVDDLQSTATVESKFLRSCSVGNKKMFFEDIKRSSSFRLNQGTEGGKATEVLVLSKQKSQKVEPPKLRQQVKKTSVSDWQNNEYRSKRYKPPGGVYVKQKEITISLLQNNPEFNLLAQKQNSDIMISPKRLKKVLLKNKNSTETFSSRYHNNNNNGSLNNEGIEMDSSMSMSSNSQQHVEGRLRKVSILPEIGQKEPSKELSKGVTQSKTARKSPPKFCSALYKSSNTYIIQEARKNIDTKKQYESSLDKLRNCEAFPKKQEHSVIDYNSFSFEDCSKGTNNQFMSEKQLRLYQLLSKFRKR